MLSEILEGWANKIKDDLGLLDDPQLKTKAEKRLVVCHTCFLRDNNTCSKKREGSCVEDFLYKDEPRLKGEFYRGCGCNLSAKALVDTANCPLGKWLNI